MLSHLKPIAEIRDARGDAGRLNTHLQPHRPAIAFVVVFLCALLTLAAFPNRYLDDLDSVNFAMALEEGFMPTRNLPHPPGYYSYVFSARVLALLTGDVTSALVWLSTLTGALTVGLLFDTGRRLAGWRAGLFAALLAEGMPVFFLNSLKALSDVPGMFGVAFALWALSRGRATLLQTAGLGFVAGLLLGVRPQSFLGITVATVLVHGLDLRQHWRQAVALVLGVLAGVALWALATLAAFSWEVNALVHYLLIAPRYIAAYESTPAALTPEVLQTRWQMLTTWVQAALGGSAPSALGSAFIFAVFAAAAVGALVPSVPLSMRRVLVLAALVQGVGYAFFLDLPQTRYLLPVLVPLNLLAAIGLARLSRGWVQTTQVALVLFVWALVATLPLAHILHSTPPPPLQVARYLNQRLAGEESVLVVARQSYIFLQREVREHPVLLLDDLVSERVHTQLREQPKRWVVVVDPEGFRPDWPYREVEQVRFQRDPRVHSKHAYVEVELFEHAPAWFAELPPDGRIDIGAPSDGAFVGLGWYRREEIGGASGRWSGAEGESALVRIKLPRAVSQLRFRAWTFIPGQSVHVECNGIPVGQFDVVGTWTDYAAPLPVGCREAGKQVELRFEVAQVRSPRELGVTADARALGFALDEVVVR